MEAMYMACHTMAMMRLTMTMPSPFHMMGVASPRNRAKRLLSIPLLVS